jgi:two-component system sensor histidine kinase CpxA
MSLRGNLFVKIFVGFWLVTTAVLASWLLTEDYFRSLPSGDLDTDPRRPAAPPHRLVLRMIYDLQHTPSGELPGIIAKARQEHRVEIFLLDPQGQELLGREVSERVARAASRLDGMRRRALDHSRGQLLVAHEIYRREEGPLRAVFQFRRPGPLLGWLGGRPWLRLGMAILISGLVCYLLSRLMTNRLKELQRAARQLAEGDLETRLLVRESGGDETDELARDFNSMAQQLQERVQAQRRLLSDVSHELRSPLARLRIALALAQDDTEKSADYLQRIEQETERLEELIGQLLCSQADKLDPDCHIDLVPLLHQLCKDANFEGQPVGKQVLFECELEQAVIASSGDLLHKSFENILRNALTHTPEHSRVTLGLTEAGDNYNVRITDQGPGVPESELARIFDEFYRVDTARTRQSGGYGLGLAIARRAIAQHGGRLQAENTGSGLAVTVLLPRSS